MIRRRRWQESPVTGESTKETVKTIAQGRPDVTGGPVVTTLVCYFYFAREAAGAAGTRLSLRPLFLEGQGFLQQLGRNARREGGLLSFAVRKLNRDVRFPLDRLRGRDEQSSLIQGRVRGVCRKLSSRRVLVRPSFASIAPSLRRARRHARKGCASSAWSWRSR